VYHPSTEDQVVLTSVSFPLGFKKKNSLPRVYSLPAPPLYLLFALCPLPGFQPRLRKGMFPSFSSFYSLLSDVSPPPFPFGRGAFFVSKWPPRELPACRLFCSRGGTGNFFFLSRGKPFFSFPRITSEFFFRSTPLSPPPIMESSVFFLFYSRNLPPLITRSAFSQYISFHIILLSWFFSDGKTVVPFPLLFLYCPFPLRPEINNYLGSPP